jgi:hypothetical protein
MEEISHRQTYHFHMFTYTMTDKQDLATYT